MGKRTATRIKFGRSVFECQLQAAFQPPERDEAVQQAKAVFDLYTLGDGERKLTALTHELEEQGFSTEGISSILQEAARKSNYMDNRWVEGTLNSQGLSVLPMTVVRTRRRRS